MTKIPLSLKKKQYLYAGAAGALGLGLIGLVLWSVDDKGPAAPSEPSKETQIATAGERINPQEVWVERMESENKLTQEKLDALEKLMIANAKSTGEAEDKVQRLERELEEFRSGKDSGVISQGSSSNAGPLFSDVGSQDVPHDTLQNDFQNGPQGNMGSGIKKIVLTLSGNGPEGKKQERSTLENTLPAGTFAKGVLLGGVDASTATSAPSDPRPVLLRITDKGTLPRKFKSDLKDCHILASCYGDLSSERVYMRLEKLTCTERLTGEISETQVAGYVVGEDGKAGVRGVVADRAGPAIRNSLLGGFFSGMGKFFEGSNRPMAFPSMPLGALNPLGAQQMLSSGVASGASQALEKYADFFIKRAEQLQPVLQVAAGREVDIVFTQGTKFGETSVRKTLTKIRDLSRKQALQTLETQAESQNWLPEVQPGDQE